jgi:hypothetical protein
MLDLDLFVVFYMPTKRPHLKASLKKVKVPM